MFDDIESNDGDCDDGSFKVLLVTLLVIQSIILLSKFTISLQLSLVNK